MSTETDIAAALTYAEDHTLADTIPTGDDRVLVRRRAGEVWDLHDVSDLRDSPRRAKGTIAVYDAASFAKAIRQRSAPPVVYADPVQLGLVAVLNDDTGDTPGWRDYRVSLWLRPTEEWQAWKRGQGLGAQQAFVERIEDGLPEIVDPAGAVMLELAQTFHASVDVKYRSGHRLANGQTQFTYDEDVKASAGSAPGTITIPDTFTLGVAPFVGTEHYEVTARLRFRLRGGDLQIGYVLVRPEAVERDAFDVIVDEAEGLVGVEFVAGPAPAQAI